jgi:hypothetical protein
MSTSAVQILTRSVSCARMPYRVWSSQHAQRPDSNCTAGCECLSLDFLEGMVPRGLLCQLLHCVMHYFAKQKAVVLQPLGDAL